MQNETTLEAAKRLTSFKEREGYDLIAVYDYFATDGSYLHSVIRWKNPITGNKYIPRMRRNSDGTYELKGPTYDNGNPLYNLMELFQNPEAPVYFVEGENKVEALRGLGVLATTAGGAQSIDKVEWQPLAGRSVSIWPDNDVAGLGMVEKLKPLLKNIGCKVEVIDVSKLGLPVKGDAVDWLQLNPKSTTGDLYRLPRLPSDELVSFATTQGRFEVSGKGVYFIPLREGNELPPKYVCSRLNVPGRARTPSGDGWSVVAEFSDGDDVKKIVLIPMADLEGDGNDVRKVLAGKGLRITSVGMDRNLLLTYLKDAPTDDRIRLVDRVGWQGDVYVSPTGSIGTGEEKFLYHGSPQAMPKWSSRGTTESCIEQVLSKARGNSRLLFGLSIALAAPLLGVIDEESRMFHFQGGSSTGKSTIAKAAASMYGKPSDMVRSYNTTKNGLGSLQSLHNDSLLVLDELSEMSPREVLGLPYQLANGVGKTRADRNGDARDTKKSRLLVISTGEISFSTHAQAGGAAGLNAGEELRALNIPVDAGRGYGAFENLQGYPTPQAFVHALQEAYQENYGTIVPEFIKRLAQDPKKAHEIRGQIEVISRNLMPESITNSQVFRVARSFALVGLAGEYATLWELTGWSLGEAEAAAKKCFNDWLEGFGGGVVSKEEEKILEAFRLFFTTHGSSRFQDASSVPADRPVINRVGFYDQEKQVYLVQPDVMKKEVLKGLDVSSAVKVLIENGYIIPGNDPRRKTQKRRVGALDGNSSNFYVVPGSVIGGAQDSDSIEEETKV